MTLPRANVALNQSLALTATSGLLWLFHHYARVLEAAILLAACALVACLILLALWWRVRLQRQLVLQAYVEPHSPLQRWLRGGLLMAVLRLPLALLLAPWLLASLVRLDDGRLWLLLLFSGPLLVWWRSCLQRGFVRHAREPYRSLLLWRIGSGTLFLLLLAAVVTLSLLQDWPDFRTATLEQAVWHLADQEVARSAALQDVLQVMAALDGLRLWLAQQILPALPLDGLSQVLAWTLVFVKKALFVWSYALVLHAVLMLTSGAGAWRQGITPSGESV